jgi:hypothetical protein
MKILAAVKFNDSRAYVLDQRPQLVYTKYNTCIIGTDGIFYHCYCYEAPSGRWKAFGGRKFTLTMQDGEVIECYGQWWDGINAEARRIIGKELISVAAAAKNDLDECYVFCSYSANPEAFQQLVTAYDGITWGYQDYDYLYCSRRKYGTRVMNKAANKKNRSGRRVVYLPKYRNQFRALRNKRPFHFKK